MKIHGLQKMTLLDFPGKVACTVFLGGCDFRCPFCHNFELVDGTAPPLMDDAELLAFLEKRRGLLDGVAFTGGEPCLHRDLPELMRKIRELGFAVKLDTNGYHPELLGQILDEGLADYVAMDVKNSPEKYAATCGVETMDLAPVRESIRLITEHGAGTGSGAAADERPGAEDDAPAFDYEFRTTVVKELHEAADFEEIGQMIRGARHYFLQSFTDRDTVPFGGFSAHTPEDLRRFAEIVRKYADDVQLRGVE